MTPHWTILDDELRFAATRYGRQRARMIVVGLGPGELLAVSPASGLDPERWAALDALGKPRFLLAPNHFHNAGLPAWVARFPDARVVAAARAQRRLRRRLPAIELGDLDELAAVLPAGIRVFGPPMARQGETWLSIRTRRGTAWFVTDAVLNPRSLPLWMRALGFRTGLSLNPFFQRSFLDDRAAWRAWVLAEIERDPPALLVPAHGEILESPEVAARLRALVERGQVSTDRSSSAP